MNLEGSSRQPTAPHICLQIRPGVEQASTESTARAGVESEGGTDSEVG